jgi:crotonobetainyl-CoA:carnitine CoA-transferase CaiB-like acyl-CoA transferase
MKQPTLAPYRILDLTNEIGFLCGKILADLGADVIKVESPCGDLARRIGPFFHNTPEAEKSLYWIGYNAGKRGITLNIESPKGRELFLKLLMTSDVLLESFTPGYLDQLNLSYAHLKRSFPRLIMTSITPYGQTGPFSRHKASDIEIMAMGGLMSLTGDPEGAPLRVSHPQSYLWTGMHAAVGTVFAIYHRGLTGKGQHVDVSAQASVVTALAHAPTFWDLNRDLPKRQGAFLTGRSVTGAKFRTMWRCKDGYVTFILYGGPAGQKSNQALVRWMEEEGKAPEFLRQKDWETFDIATMSQQEVDEMERAIEELLLAKTKEEFYHQAIERRILGYPVSTAKDICEDPQLEAREFWRSIPFPELSTNLVFPGPFAIFSRSFCGPSKKAPRIGEHNEEIYCGELGIAPEELTHLSQEGAV